jgi:DNA-binding NarL/FixJ family response regulator
MLNITIADDHDLIINGFKEVIKKEYPDKNIFSANNLDTLKNLLERQPIDLLFQDIRFGKDDARVFIQEIKNQYPLLKVVIISSLDDLNNLQILKNQGIDGYILKSDENQEILNAIVAVEKGNFYFSKGLRSLLAENSIVKIKKEEIYLTPREKEVLSLILNEKTTKEIAATLFLSEKTIENYRANLLLKFNVKFLAGLVKKAILEGYV